MSKSRIFVSHAVEDSAYVRKLLDAFRTEHLSAWSPAVAPLTSTEAREIKTYIESALEKASCFVVLASPASLSSQWVAFEVGVALGRRGGEPNFKMIMIYKGVPEVHRPTWASSLISIDAGGKTPSDVAACVANILAPSHRTRPTKVAPRRGGK